MSIRDKFEAIEASLKDGSTDGIDAIDEFCELYEEVLFEGEDGSSISLDEISSRILELSIQESSALEKAAEVDPADCATWW